MYEKARDEGLSITQSEVKNWLEYQQTFVRFKQPTRNFSTRQTHVPYMADQLQMDLVDMSKYQSQNKDYTDGF